MNNLFKILHYVGLSLIVSACSAQEPVSTESSLSQQQDHQVVNMPLDYRWQDFTTPIDQQNLSQELLYFGLPESDDRFFVFSCNTSGEWVDIDIWVEPSLSASADERVISLQTHNGSSQHNFRFPAKIKSRGDGENRTLVHNIREHSSHPMFTALFNATQVDVNVSSKQTFRFNQTLPNVALKNFIQRCGGSIENRINNIDTNSSLNHDLLTSGIEPNSFKCEGYEQLFLTYFSDRQNQAELILRNGPNIYQMDSVISGSGAKFSGDGAIFWSKGDMALFFPNADNEETFINCAVQN